MCQVLDAVPHSFKAVMSDMRAIERHLSRYCVSFYRVFNPMTSSDGGHMMRRSNTTNSLLATAATYSRQIDLRHRAIDGHLSSVQRLVDRFRTAELRLADLGAYGSDLARRTGSAHAPYLLLFPCACRCIRLAMDEMRSWLADDRSYAEFIANDVDRLEVMAESTKHRLREANDEYHRAAFR